MLAVQPLRTVNQFPVQIRIIQKSTERHIRVIRTLMFIKAQCFVNQKWNIIFVFHVNDIFQSWYMRYGLPHYTDSGHFLCFRQTVSGIRCPYIFYLHECHHLFLSLTVGIPFVKILCLSTYIIAYFGTFYKFSLSDNLLFVVNFIINY